MPGRAVATSCTSGRWQGVEGACVEVVPSLPGWGLFPSLAALTVCGNPRPHHSTPCIPRSPLTSPLITPMSSPGDTLPDVTSWENVHHGVSNGDFARLVPHSPAARRLFGQVVRLLESDSSKLHHVRQYIHYEVTLSSESTAESSFAASTPSPQPEPLQEFCGYYRLNMFIPPASQGLGWVVGSSRLNKPDHFVDFLLAPFTTENSLHSRHCRLRRQLESGVMVAVSDGRKVLQCVSSGARFAHDVCRSLWTAEAFNATTRSRSTNEIFKLPFNMAPASGWVILLTYSSIPT